MNFYSLDLFSGVGGLSQGMIKAGFNVVAAIELDKNAAKAYRLNHPEVNVIERDIREVKIAEIKKLLNGKKLDLLAGCPPCQGFSSVRRKNKKKNVQDSRNALIDEYLRFVKGLRPKTILLENVPGLTNYYRFKEFIKELIKLGYEDAANFSIVNMKDYEIPQRRRRLTLVASRLGKINIAEGSKKKVTVRDVIGNLQKPENSEDSLHKIFRTHTEKTLERIRLTPSDGGSRKDLPIEFALKCHKKKNVGFNDIYGRLRWDDYSTTITGGCLNPSKGRFLHPEQDRCISAREASLLQSFPPDYKFPLDVNKDSLALMIGNSLPPNFSYIQMLNIRSHLEKYRD
jgi:DNA (cytosine-5)-methyltransferase 1